jgi:hypothetical protein
MQPTLTPEQLIARVEELARKNPDLSGYFNRGHDLQSLLYSANTGDLSNLTDFSGQPFTKEVKDEALKNAKQANDEFYDQQKEKETADTEAALKSEQSNYQNYLANAGNQFQTDKTNLDQNAATQGVLFSGGRAQKEQKLQQQYDLDQAQKSSSVQADIGQTARDYQYKYGANDANKLSDLYKTDTNTYNPKIAQGGVSKNPLSTAYNVGDYSFGGTRNAEQATSAAQRAAGILANRGNKLLSTSYKNPL